ncbi:hypothetical protein PZ938_19165 [Luteipulveratus sp. YIM 133132]|uniref:hypothetical protein n=1 Tax=Luteipulveratus flavus TaxID=3031728 RepID=UPI0023B17881|nr:hypothetical protein [Luteipulveratus sp. YIM 133132]MDE9367743.1 hypothetical protein [Luteipulveratus sp. YIM 133132]
MPESSALLATRVAAAVPRLLAVQVEPAEEETADVVDEAVERLADGLLHWHDELVAGRGEHRLPAPRSDADVARSPHASRGLATAIRAGRMPGNPFANQTAAGRLREVRAVVDEVTEQVGDPGLRETGACLSGALDDLAAGLLQQAGTLQEESGRLATLRRTPGATGVSSGPTPVDQLLGRVVRAEHRLQRVAATTLRS